MCIIFYGQNKIELNLNWRHTNWGDDKIVSPHKDKVLSVPMIGSFTCLGIGHAVQGTLWLYVQNL